MNQRTIQYECILRVIYVFIYVYKYVVDVDQVLVEAEAVLAKVEAVALHEAGVAVALVVAVVVHQGAGAEVEVVARIVLQETGELGMIPDHDLMVGIDVNVSMNVITYVIVEVGMIRTPHFEEMICDAVTFSGILHHI